MDETTRSRLASALDRVGVVSAVLFGSEASGRAGPSSDIDIAVWLDPDLNADERLAARIRLTEEVAAALKTDRIDLVVLNDAPPLLQHRAREGGVRLVERDARSRIRLESRALVEYLDTQPLRDELARGTGHRLAEERFGRS